MISCDPNLLSAYLDRTLTLPARVRLEEHVKDCHACGRELDALRRVDELLAVWGSRRAPIPMATESRIAASVTKRRRLGRVLAWSKMMPAALGSTVAAFIVVLSLNAGVLFSNPALSGSPAASGSFSQTIVKQSRPLIDARRTNALFGSHVATLTVTVNRGRLQTTTV